MTDRTSPRIEIPPPPPRQPVRWRRAWRELRELIANRLGAAFEIWRTLGWRWLAYDFRAWRRGRRATWLVALPWEELLPLRVATVCRLAGVAEASEIHTTGILRGSRGDARYVPA
ncbi:MAG: hypothetical protein E6J87_17010 [Deltaproteobacteria bacterium]|nr:MAG: hypothetical protein E6J87_17010 [Deltaproteobacteria bacterium]